MFPLRLFDGLGRPPRILCLGAHPDDIEIGCGGSILALSEAIPEAAWHWAVFSGNETRHTEARASFARFLGEAADATLELQSFRDGFLPFEGAAVKECMESIKTRIEPDLIWTHRRDDRHQDHRLIGELTWNTWRNHQIFEYEIPKFEGDLGQPQAYIPLTQKQARRKAALTLESFPSQRSREWFDEDLFMGLMRVRGVECNAPGRYAEAFYAPKSTVTFGSAARSGEGR